MSRRSSLERKNGVDDTSTGRVSKRQAVKTICRVASDTRSLYVFAT